MIGISVSAQADDDVAPPALELLVTLDGGVSTSSFDYSVLPAAMQTTITDPNEGKKIDIKEVNTDLSPTHLTVNVVLYTPVTSETLAYTWFDLDQNPSTGLTDADTPDYGLNDIGADFYMLAYKGYTDALVIDADTGYYTEVPVSWTPNSFTAIIPLSALDNDDGNMDVTQMAGENGMYLTDCDIAPNTGHGEIMACPDADGDGVCDADDHCPNDQGPDWNCGCPCIGGGDGDVVCTSNYVTNMVTSPISDHSEDWGPATEDIATKYQWRTGATRIIIPMSDEAPEDGDGCNDPGDDRDSITSAIAACNANSVIASPVMCSGQSACGEALGQALASGTGGTMFKSTDPSSDLINGIKDLISHSVCDFDGDGTPDCADQCAQCYCCCNEPTCPPGGPCVVWIDNVTAPPSGTATGSIMLDVNDFGSATIELKYDPTVVQVQSVSQGDCGAVFENIDNANGKTRISSQGTGAIPGPSGTLEFAEIGFKAIGSVGECSPLSLNVVVLAHSDGSDITPATTCDGEFCITQTCRICGDVNCDCKVDIVDAMFIAQYTVGNRQTPCDPCPDPYPCACGGDGGPLSGSP
jgi:hypothetical protein